MRWNDQKAIIVSWTKVTVLIYFAKQLIEIVDIHQVFLAANEEAQFVISFRFLKVYDSPIANI